MKHNGEQKAVAAAVSRCNGETASARAEKMDENSAGLLFLNRGRALQAPHEGEDAALAAVLNACFSGNSSGRRGNT